MDELGKALDRFNAKISLIHEKCNLNHGIGTERSQAVDYLCQYVGLNTVSRYLLTIPICAECAAALYDEEWLLFYCLTCNSSQWLLKNEAKKLYPKWESIIFLTECPMCVGKERKFEE